MRDRLVIVCVIGAVCVVALAGIFALLAIIGPDPRLVLGLSAILPIISGLAYGLARAFRNTR